MSTVISFPGPASATAEFRREVSHLRRRARDQIERLIAFLDTTEDDADAEDDGTAEPWLAAPECRPSPAWNAGPSRDRSGDQSRWASGGFDDREEDYEDEGAMS